MQTATESLMILEKFCSSITVDADGKITVWVADVIPFVINSTGLYGRGI